MTTIEQVRRVLATLGGVVAEGGRDHVLDLAREGAGSPRRATIRAARPPVPIAVASPAAAAFEGFLDGISRHVVVAHVRGAPVVFGTTGAAIRERVDGRLRTWGTPRIERAVYAPGGWFDAELVDALRTALGAVGIPVVETEADRASDAPRHPATIAGAALLALARARDALERDCALEWCAAHDARALYVDGTIGRGARRLEAPGAIGVVKSHGTLYVADDAGAQAVFALGEAERTPVGLVMDGETPAGVATWYLRLRDATGRDPFFGLVRVEIAARDLDATALEVRADTVSGWLLAERAPLATPDAHWDVLPYAARDVGRWLRAVA